MDNNNKYSYDASVNASVSRRRRRRSTLRAQKRAIIVIGALTVLLAITLGIVSYFVGRIVYTDEVDGARYYVKEKNGEFVLCDSDGYTLPVTPDGYFSTEAGTLVDVDEKSGACKTVAIVDTDDAEEIYTADFVFTANDQCTKMGIDIPCQSIRTAGNINHTAQAGLINLPAKVRSQPCPRRIHQQQNPFRFLFPDMSKHCGSIPAKKTFFASPMSLQIRCRCLYCKSVQFDSEDLPDIGS